MALGAGNRRHDTSNPGPVAQVSPQDVRQISGSAVRVVCNAKGGSLKCQVLRVGLD